MWNEVIHLLQLQFTDDEQDQFVTDLQNLNDWIRRQYGPLGLTCEEVTQAYNLLVMEELRKSDGRVLEAWPRLDPRHAGEVLAAYRRRIEADTDVNRVLANALYLPEPQAPNEEQIDQFMERALTYALNQVRSGEDYVDTGNGLYKWLFQKGRIRPTESEWEASVIEAQHQIRQDVMGLKRLPGSHGGQKQLRELMSKGLENALMAQPEYKVRVREQAWRICLNNFLRNEAGTIALVPKVVRLTPKVPPGTVFSQAQYIANLRDQLPHMDDTTVADLRQNAFNRNVLDVYELTSAELNRRQSNSANQSTPNNQSTASAVRIQ